MNWTLRLAAEQPPPPAMPPRPADRPADAARPSAGLRCRRAGHEGRWPSIIATISRSAASCRGPAIIAEDETTTVVPKSFAARISPIGAILLEKV